MESVVPIVTCFTPSYYDHANVLREDCNALGVPFIGIPYIDQGSWMENCRMKPSLLFDAGIGQPFLFTDADSRLRRKPDMTPYSGMDIAAPRQKGDNDRVWYSGTVYCAGNAEAMAFLLVWMDLIREMPDKSDWYTFTEAWIYTGDGLVWGELPDAFASLPAFPAEDPIIEIGLSGEATKFNMGKK